MESIIENKTSDPSSAVTDSRVSSPFHEGERWLQEAVGVRERMEHFGRRVIRDHLPEQHRAFYQQLPFLLLGYSDEDGWPWVSLVAGEPGFVQSSDNTSLQISTEFMPGDPLKKVARSGLAMGGLGLEPHSRRRNRFSTELSSASSSSVDLKVRQTFGNCPQYIQTHKIKYAAVESPGDTEIFTKLDDDALDLIQRSDTFFVASQTLHNDEVAAGADVSHRGGKPGFVQVDQSDGRCILTVPDYPGNNHFNTLGNFLLNPRAGLLFWDLQSQDVLLLTGDVNIVDDHPLLPFFEGAERFWQFSLHKGVRLRKQLPLSGELGELSPNTLMTGDWNAARKARDIHQFRHRFQSYIVIGKVQESEKVVSIYLKPNEGSAPSFKAGQFITLKIPELTDDRGNEVVRTYTVSNAPHEGSYRISIKRLSGNEDSSLNGMASNYLHDEVFLGDLLQVKAPQGDFHWQDDSERPVVLLAAGIGITPMISMVRHAIREQVRSRRFQHITLVVAARDSVDQVFRDELSHLLEAAEGYLRVCWCFTQPGAGMVKGRDYQVEGRPNGALLQSLLPLADYDFYLCGPGLFMQEMHESLSALGVQAQRIFSEAFGPSSILPAFERDKSSAVVALNAGVQLFDQDDNELFELNWQKKDGALLEFAEGHGVNPPSGCRNGRCGSCAADLLAGDVVYDNGCQAPGEGQVLLCCSQPAEGSDLRIRLKAE